MDIVQGIEPGYPGRFQRTGGGEEEDCAMRRPFIY